jgi:DNA invertase Pin-like site-specific DNA recombinase
MTSKVFGYGRVSTTDQNLDEQSDDLTAFGVDELYVEKHTGTKANRPQWNLVKSMLRSGDTLVVTKLDRLGRSTRDLLEISAFLESKGVNLVTTKQKVDTTTPEGRLFFTMVAAFAEFEHSMMKARTMDGLAAARARGRVGGRKSKLTPQKVADIRARYEAKETVQSIADYFEVSRPTIYRALEITV